MVEPVTMMLAASAIIGVLGASNQADDAKDAARFNSLAAIEDNKLISAEASQKVRIQCEAGARQMGAIKGAAAASGVKVSSGSTLDVITEQASVNARNEYLVDLEAKFAKTRNLQAARTGSVAARNRAAGFMIGSIGDVLSTSAIAMN